MYILLSDFIVSISISMVSYEFKIFFLIFGNIGAFDDIVHVTNLE